MRPSSFYFILSIMIFLFGFFTFLLWGPMIIVAVGGFEISGILFFWIAIKDERRQLKI